MRLIATCDTCKHPAPLKRIERERDDVLTCAKCIKQMPRLPEFVRQAIRVVIAEDRRERAVV